MDNFYKMAGLVLLTLFLAVLCSAGVYALIVTDYDDAAQSDSIQNHPLENITNVIDFDKKFKDINLGWNIGNGDLLEEMLISSGKYIEYSLLVNDTNFTDIPTDEIGAADEIRARMTDEIVAMRVAQSDMDDAKVGAGYVGCTCGCSWYNGGYSFCLWNA